MDFISIVKKEQKKMGLTNKDVSEKLGIMEIEYDYLLDYRKPLTNLLYFGLCSIFGISVTDVTDIICENKTLVGVTDNFLSDTKGYFDYEYVSKLQNELMRLKGSDKRVEDKQVVINKLFIEKSELEKELKELQEETRRKVQESYVKGMNDWREKVPLTQLSQERGIQREIEREYISKIDRLEAELKECQDNYLLIYNFLQELSMGISLSDINMDRFPKPKKIEKLEDKIDDTLKETICMLYYTYNMSVQDISVETRLSYSLVNKVIREEEINRKRK